MTIEERLEKLERELSRVNQAVGGTFNELRAYKFVLEDENGKSRAVIGVSKDGPALRLLDENGKPRVELSIWKDGPGLVLLDENGNRLPIR